MNNDDILLFNVKCDGCENVASFAERDVIEIPSNGKWKKYKPYGVWRYGCPIHRPRKSKVYNIGDKDYPIEEAL